MAERYLDSHAAAKYLGRSYSRLDQWRRSGEGPKCVKRMGRWYYAESDLDAWIRGEDQPASAEVSR